jgi:hypothetical protein
MLQTTATIIGAALQMDASMTDKDRVRIMRALKLADEDATPPDFVRRRIHTRQVCRILGINYVTFWRWAKEKPHYAALSKIEADGRENFYYLDEIERLRDGLHPISGEPWKVKTEEQTCADKS